MRTIVPAVKPQCAYYEMYGWQGMKDARMIPLPMQKKRVCSLVTDGKRNDIGTTMEAYAAAHLGQVDVQGALCKLRRSTGDCLTVNGYLGFRRYLAAAGDLR